MDYDLELFRALTGTEAKINAVADCSSEGELDAMWRAWSGQGYSDGGVIHSLVLMRKEDLCGLADRERAVLERSLEAQGAGAALPPVSGHANSGNE